ncbi:hypothetical protein BN946_scf184912.g27 [Trametes cinnabarina]|uniref:Uncharacterized protein n=1 Tax=Pycnoporus cinnabarinus TaxID=5643 RepID=A0A060SYA1_PYCCI|nr:hypothetical protein BN946_scf184912.g27 [Trametes cinnabarina]
MPDSERSVTPFSAERRSVYRGRDAFSSHFSPAQSSGRGGIGNMHRPSDTASPTRPGDEPLSPVRGREATVDPERAKSTGRGGMGNIRSGSRARSASQIPIPENHPQTASLVSDQAANIAEYEKYVVQQSEEAAKARAPQRSSGRGGLGNIRSKSKSRSRSRVPHVLSTGRGGVGNLQPGTNLDADLITQLEEEERLRHAHEAGIDSDESEVIYPVTPPPRPRNPTPSPIEYEFWNPNERDQSGALADDELEEEFPEQPAQSPTEQERVQSFEQNIINGHNFARELFEDNINDQAIDRFALFHLQDAAWHLLQALRHIRGQPPFPAPGDRTLHFPEWVEVNLNNALQALSSSHAGHPILDFTLTEYTTWQPQGYSSESG